VQKKISSLKTAPQHIENSFNHSATFKLFSNDEVIVSFQEHISAEDFFKGIIKLALSIQNESDPIISQISPSLKIKKSEGLVRQELLAQFDDESFSPVLVEHSKSGIPKLSNKMIASACAAKKYSAKLLVELPSSYSPEQSLLLRNPKLSFQIPALFRKFQGHFLSDRIFLLENITMTDETTENEHPAMIRTQLYLGTIEMELNDFIALSPGAEIKLVRSEKMQGALCLDGQHWAPVDIEFSENNLKLSVATLPEKPRILS